MFLGKVLSLYLKGTILICLELRAKIIVFFLVKLLFNNFLALLHLSLMAHFFCFNFIALLVELDLLRKYSPLELVTKAHFSEDWIFTWALQLQLIVIQVDGLLSEDEI